MKIITEQQKEAAAKATMWGGFKGAVTGLAVAATALSLGSRRYPAIRNIPTVQRGWLMTFAALATGATNGELSYEAFLKQQWTDRGAEILHEEEHEREIVVQSMGIQERALRWAKENRYRIIGLSWVGAVALSSGLVFAKNPTQSFTQKIVQVRIYAQGVTLAVLLATAGLSTLKFEDDDAMDEQKAQADAWKRMIDEPENGPAQPQQQFVQGHPHAHPQHHAHGAEDKHGGLQARDQTVPSSTS